MNNSRIALDNVSLELEEKADNTPSLRERESKLVRIIEALTKVSESREWKELKSLLFDNLLESLEKRLRLEVDKDIINLAEVQFLKGQIRWAKNYSDLEKLADENRKELSNIRKTYE